MTPSFHLPGDAQVVAIDGQPAREQRPAGVKQIELGSLSSLRPLFARDQGRHAAAGREHERIYPIR
jgi:hypothetical protein